MSTTEDIVKLRKRTNCGMMDCKNALEACNGDLDKATEWLREKGMAKAAKKADRIAAEGLVTSYIHMGGKIGVLLEVNCETDFASKSEQFAQLCKDIAMHIAAANPLYVKPEEVPAADLEHEKEILKAQALNEGKPEKIVERMIEGRIKKFYEDTCLLNQPFVKNPEQTVTDLINETVLKIGEKISVRRFVRYEMGEGLEKRTENFAEEVMNQANGNK
ncbi:MAG: translation elongation factor Ts [Firmicutes bacterium]|nr:translation elongation factor Ts [Bacillota bacterium]MDY5042020.1 translation elongation factor Ts [Eubacteriales bacterium]